MVNHPAVYSVRHKYYSRDIIINIIMTYEDGIYLCPLCGYVNNGVTFSYFHLQCHLVIQTIYQDYNCPFDMNIRRTIRSEIIYKDNKIYIDVTLSKWHDRELMYNCPFCAADVTNDLYALAWHIVTVHIRSYDNMDEFYNKVMCNIYNPQYIVTQTSPWRRFTIIQK
jgi:hypothetical protein